MPSKPGSSPFFFGFVDVSSPAAGAAVFAAADLVGAVATVFAAVAAAAADVSGVAVGVTVGVGVGVGG